MCLDSVYCLYFAIFSHLQNIFYILIHIYFEIISGPENNASYSRAFETGSSYNNSLINVNCSKLNNYNSDL